MAFMSQVGQLWHQVTKHALEWHGHLQLVSRDFSVIAGCRSVFTSLASSFAWYMTCKACLCANRLQSDEK